MDERFALTRNVAEKLILLTPWHQCLKFDNSSLTLFQRLNNSLILFPTIIQINKKCREIIFQVFIQNSNKLIQVINNNKNNNSNKDVNQLWIIYVSVLIDTIQSQSIINYFTDGQQKIIINLINQCSIINNNRENRKIIIEEFRQQFLNENISSSLLNDRASMLVSNGKSLIPINQLPRQSCTSCGKSSQPFYCTGCYHLINVSVKNIIPNVSLPFQLHIIFHPDYDRSKSTALHTKLLCNSSNVVIHTWPNIPVFDQSQSLLLFPDESSIQVSEALNQIQSNKFMNSNEFDGDKKNLSNIIIIEATWPQARLIVNHKNLSSLIHLRLNSVETRFWRYQQHGPNYLSSIEAIHPCMKEIQKTNFIANFEFVDVDCLLWLFNLGWWRVRDYYREQPKILVPPRCQ